MKYKTKNTNIELDECYISAMYNHFGIERNDLFESDFNYELREDSLIIDVEDIEDGKVIPYIATIYRDGSAELGGVTFN